MNESELAGLLTESAAAHVVPGAAVGVVCDGTVTAGYTGVASTASGESVTADTRFAVGSLGKSMVATAVVHLCVGGEMSLDDSAIAHVPELRGSGWAERVTVRDLLANRSRLPLRAALEFSTFAGDEDDVLSRFAAEVARGDAMPPHWSYTNAGWCLLGRALEQVTGLVFEDAMRACLFEPLGLEQTTFTTSPQAGASALGHTAGAGGPAAVEPWAPRSLGPAGSTVLSTVTDLLRFADSHLRDPSLAVMRETHADIRLPGWFDGWCLGWGRLDWAGGTVWGWDGIIAGQRSVLRLVPERRGAVVLLTNAGNGRDLYRSLVPRLMESWFGIGMPALQLEPMDERTADLTRFAGVYAWPDRRWEVTAADTHLVMECDGRTVEAPPIDDRTFLLEASDPDWPTVTFDAFDESGRPGVLYEMLWGLPRV